MFTRKLSRWIAPALLTLPLAACGGSESPKIGEGDEAADASTSDRRDVNIGAPLYEREEYAEINVGEIVPDPVVVPQAQLTVMTQEEVPSRVEGYIQFIGTELAGLTPEQQAIFLRDVNDKKREIFKHPRTGKEYIELKLGDPVEEGQVVALLDDKLSFAEFERLNAALKGAKEDARFAMKAMQEFAPLGAVFRQLQERGFSSDVEAIQVLLRKLEQEGLSATKQARVPEVEGEVKKAELQLAIHTIRSEISGTVTATYRRKGEAIRNSEPLLQIQNFDKLRVEGLVDREHAGDLEPGMIVEVEPTVTVAPYLTRIAHRQPITGLAVGFSEGEPLVVTASEDRTVRVWNGLDMAAVWDHPSVVHAVACPPKESGVALALTGADDGIGRIYDLASPSDEPWKELKDGHDGGILAVAFSPDGKTCATADDRRAIVLWDVSSAKKLYSLDGAHRGPITAIQFTPQGRLISVGRDNTVRIWELGKKDAKLERTIENRAGDVNGLCACGTGDRVLFDRGKSELHVLSVKDGRTLQVIKSDDDSDKFTEFARFSPDNRMVLTASNRGALHLFRMSDDPNGHVEELRRLNYPTRARATCGVFIPNENGVIVVGDESGHLYVWLMPTVAEMNQKYQATITFIENQIETSGEKLRVYAELANTGDVPLRPGIPCKMVVQPTPEKLARK